MVSKFLPGSSTKNFGWRKHPERLYHSIREGFGHKLEPVTRDQWRKACDLHDSNIELIPLNFFLYSKPSLHGDRVMVDRLVEFAVIGEFDEQFLKLAVFAFHAANSGRWHNTDWTDGRVAGWANYLIRKTAWQHGDWTSSIFEPSSLLSFMKEHVIATPVTLRKMRNNYRFMLQRAGILEDSTLEKPRFDDQEWILAAPQLFWDRQIFDGKLTRASRASDFEAVFFEHEIHKLLRCSEVQGQAIARASFREYAAEKLESRFVQLEGLDRKAA